MKAILRSIRKLIFKSMETSKKVKVKKASLSQLKALCKTFFQTFVLDPDTQLGGVPLSDEKEQEIMKIMTIFLDLHQLQSAKPSGTAEVGCESKRSKKLMLKQQAKK